ncbi:MAG: hypothetical protein AAFP26_14900, partial [Planctomycetota bacterium]
DGWTKRVQVGVTCDTHQARSPPLLLIIGAEDAAMGMKRCASYGSVAKDHQRRQQQPQRRNDSTSSSSTPSTSDCDSDSLNRTPPSRRHFLIDKLSPMLARRSHAPSGEKKTKMGLVKSSSDVRSRVEARDVHHHQPFVALCRQVALLAQPAEPRSKSPSNFLRTSLRKIYHHMAAPPNAEAAAPSNGGGEQLYLHHHHNRF